MIVLAVDVVLGIVVLLVVKLVGLLAVVAVYNLVLVGGAGLAVNVFGDGLVLVGAGFGDGTV